MQTAKRAKLEMMADAIREQQRRRSLQNTVVGLVTPEGKLSHCIEQVGEEWEPTNKEPDVYLAIKLESALKSNKRFIVIIGGRGSSKSVGVADIRLIKAKDNNEKTYCLREFQSSIKNSVHSLLKDEIERLEFRGFDIMDNGIKKDEEDIFQFAGIARNVASIKSAHGFKCFFIEEAQFLSQDSLDVLTPTARNKPNKGLPRKPEELADESFTGVSMVFVANPESSEDPFSQRFIVPYEDKLLSDGYYEDDMHLIITMNYHDNPWFMESGLEAERQWAKNNLSNEMYEHVWLGGFNDSVENSLILAEWFDACVDAHLKVGTPEQWLRGAKIGSHDASDQGGDSKSYAYRYGSVVQDVREKLDGDVNEGGHWACKEALNDSVDFFTFDGDGLGAGLNEQISVDFKEKPVRIAMYKGSEGCDNPESIYKPSMQAEIENQKKNKDVFANKRAQYYVELRDRVYRTYRAVKFGEISDPDTMISFNGNMKLLKKLRAELCRMPIKPHKGGLISLYTKLEMRTKFKFKSPNLADAVVMSLRYVSINVTKPYIPSPLGKMGAGTGRRHR